MHGGKNDVGTYSTYAPRSAIQENAETRVSKYIREK